MNKFTQAFFLIFFGALSVESAHSKSELIPVKVAILESLSPKGSTASVRYREGLEGALMFALGKNLDQITSCGYKATTSFRYFNKDEEGSENKVSQEFLTEKGGRPWIIIGARRSKHFLSIAKGFRYKQPLVSLAANSPEVFTLDAPNFTINHSVDDLSRQTVKHLNKNFNEKLNKLITVLDTSCTFCSGFYKKFKRHLEKSNIKESAFFEFKRDDDFDERIKSLRALIKKEKPHFILLPNYSKLSGRIIEKTQDLDKNIVYIGSDGWGNGIYGYLITAKIDKGTKGFSIYPGGDPVKFVDKKGWHGLNRHYRGTYLPPATSHAGIVEVVNRFAKLLCEKRPKNLREFVRATSSLPIDYFKTDQGMGLFVLKNSEFKFSREVHP